ncbi:MAG TPA: family 78 glycoside hydrolase catalytic domain [Puia sp.]|jgi:alpha-L-rhamnosidase|nr:family 78 glycoside hydrolase catalytic domain [Puia sp.]
MVKTAFVSTLLLLSLYANAQVKVIRLLCDDRVEPVGLGDPHPRLSWRLEGSGQDILQSAYELLVSGPHSRWSSGKVRSAQSVHVAYDGEPLASGQHYSWQVRVWDQTGKPSAWSAPAFWQMGLLRPDDWTAQWISPGFAEDSVDRPSPILRRQFFAKAQPVRATLYITAHGLYDARLNGQPVTDARFTPGYTEYDHRFQYQAYDATALIHSGNNNTEVTLGDGWYRGIFGPWNNPNNYGRDASLLYQLVIAYRNGSTDTVISDAFWQCSTGSIRYADIYNGEIDDARILPANWTNVIVQTFPKNNLVATLAEPVREHETFTPVAILTSPRGEKIIDFGQNLAGWVRFKVRGKSGDTIRISHAETLDQDGNFYTANLREARAQDIYVLRGDGEETFEPHFTFHGFRYIKVEGYPGEIRPEDFRSVSLYSSLPVTGSFHCSDSLINRLQLNIVWSQQSNFIDIPTDCPQRSERLGWAGDVQLFAPTAAFNKRVDEFFEKWLEDVRLAQGPDGGMPDVVPDIRNRTIHRAPRGVAGWGDAAVILPWTLFQIYGDTTRLAASYNSMRAWVQYIHSRALNGLWKGGGYGDWLAPDPVPEKGRDSVKATPTDLPFISQCYYFYSTTLLARTAGALGRSQDSVYYSTLADTIRNAFLAEYMTPGARAISNTQTAYILALYTGILPESMAARAAQRLAELVKANQDHLGTGFLGTPYLCPVLTKYGYTDLAYALLQQTTPPSWLYPVKMGATTIWEKWLSVLPNRSINVSSFNNYAYGAIGDWLYRDVAGISPGSPGYRRIIIHPHPGGTLTEVDASYDSDYGLIRCHWKKTNDNFQMEVEIPANTRADVYIPGKDPDKVRKMELGSGKYSFTAGQ